MEDRIGNDCDPGGTPDESSADEATYHVHDTKLLVSAFDTASNFYTCSSIGDVPVTADGSNDPIPIPKLVIQD